MPRFGVFPSRRLLGVPPSAAGSSQGSCSWLMTLDVDEGTALKGHLRQLIDHRQAVITLPLPKGAALQPDRLRVVGISDPVAVATAGVRHGRHPQLLTVGRDPGPRPARRPRPARSWSWGLPS